MYTPHTLAEAILVVGVTSPMRKILEACRWRLTSCEGGYVANDVGGLPLVLTIYLAVIVIITIGLGQGLPPVSHFCVTRSVVIGGEGKIHLTGAWATMLWVGPWIRFLSHLLPEGLKWGSFFGGLLIQRSLSTMVGRTLWSMWATLTRGWLFIRRMKSWCARCSHPVWGMWRWDGSTV